MSSHHPSPPTGCLRGLGTAQRFCFSFTVVFFSIWYMCVRLNCPSVGFHFYFIYLLIMLKQQNGWRRNHTRTQNTKNKAIKSIHQLHTIMIETVPKNILLPDIQTQKRGWADGRFYISQVCQWEPTVFTTVSMCIYYYWKFLAKRWLYADQHTNKISLLIDWLIHSFIHSLNDWLM